MTSIKDIFKDAMPVIKDAAPILGGLIGGPTGLVLGNLVPLLATAFGTHPANLGDLVTAIMNDPHAPAKLKSVEDMHSDWLSTMLDSVSGLTEAEINIKLKWDCDQKAS